MIWNSLPKTRYDVVYADPPWSYYGQQTKWGAASKFYSTVSDDDLLSFPMQDLLAEQSILFLWTTSPRLDFALRCIGAWGLHYRGVGFVWVKTRKTGEPIGAQGVRPSIVKPTVEYVLAASTVKKGRPLKLADESVRNTVFAPKGAHSEKPDEVRQSIERMYPERSKLEIFARHRHHGWDAWGNEVSEGPRHLPRGHGSKDNRRVRDALANATLKQPKLF